MLIASSTPSLAAWQTAPTRNSFEASQSSRSQNSESNTAQQAQNAADSSEQTAYSDGQNNDGTGTGTPQRSPRRGRSATQDSESTQSTSAADAKTSSATSDAQQQAFQAILNEVMPPVDGQAAKAELASTARTKLDQSLPQATADTTANSNQAGAAKGQYAEALDPAFQITKEAQLAGGNAALSQKLADAQVAFAARVTQQAGTAATLDLRNSQETIAASRFDTARPGANTSVDPQTAPAAKPADQANLSATPAAKPTSQAPAPAAADSQGSADANANDANANSDSDPHQRDTDGPDTVRADSEPETAATALQTAPAPVAGNGAGVRQSSPAKASAESAAPQLQEPQDEPGVHAGESVRNISLRLTNADQSSVQVRLTERAGELQVSVRTPDAGLTRGLRDGLPDLMSRLQVNGYKADTWQPGGNGNSAGQDQGQDAPSHGHSQQRNGDGSGSQGQQQSGNQQDEQTPKWVSELESSIQRSNNPWRPAV